MKSEYDGSRREWWFGSLEYGNTSRWKVEANSLAKAIRAFRVGAVFPHQYVDPKDRIPSGDGHYLASKPGATVPISLLLKSKEHFRKEWVEVARIPPEGEEAQDYTMRVLPSSVRDQLREKGDSTALVMSQGASRLPADLSSASRQLIEQKQLELQALQNNLNKQMAVIRGEMAALKAEIEQRLEQIWAIELFLGTHEEVKCLAEGKPAPVGTPISVHQRTLCIDEELALWDWFNNPERIGEFEWLDLEDFDRWLVEDPGHLDIFLPEPKGIVALRVRRHEKDRGPSESISETFKKVGLAETDAYTYLLIRNGENVYRIWADVRLWPRFFPRFNEFDWLNSKKNPWTSDRTKARDAMKHFMGGLLAVQGILERSDLLHPLPAPKINVFDPDDVGAYFTLIRDDEDQLKLGDGNLLSRLTWKGYKKWLKEQTRIGARVLYIGKKDYRHNPNDHHPLYYRTGIQTVGHWPSKDEIYTIDRKGDDSWYSGAWSFLYHSPDTIWSSDGWESHERVKRVRFRAFKDEVIPFDAISWRVVEHLLRDRDQREHYSEFFTTLFHWWAKVRAETAAEAPFIDLVLGKAGVSRDNKVERARAERLVRWWKLKTKEARTLDKDEAKALRMVLKAFKAGEDHTDDPETHLMESLT